jgi:hypothetical protein
MLQAILADIFVLMTQGARCHIGFVGTGNWTVHDPCGMPLYQKSVSGYNVNVCNWIARGGRQTNKHMQFEYEIFRQ